MSLIRDTEEVIKFLQFASRETMIDATSVESKVSACQSFFRHILEEEDHVDYMLANLDSLLAREAHSEQSLSCFTREEKKDLIRCSLEDYRAWSSDPFGWERKIHQKNVTPPNEDRITTNSKKRVLQLPIRDDFSVEVSLPAEGLSIDEFQRLGMFLYPYCKGISFGTSIPWPGKE